VQTLTAYAGMALLCLMTVYGPLLHEHPAGEVDGRSAVIHAHFPEPEPVLPPNENSIGFRHLHGKAVWLDGFTTTTVDALELIVVVSASFIIPAPQYAPERLSWIEMPRAHSPPVLDSGIPRSPPV